MHPLPQSQPCLLFHSSSICGYPQQSIQQPIEKLPQRSPTGITTQHLFGPAAWLCPHTWQIAWCQSSPWNLQAVSRFTGQLLYINQIITITPSHNLLILDTDLSENRLPHSIHWLIIRFHLYKWPRLGACPMFKHTHISYHWLYNPVYVSIFLQEPLKSFIKYIEIHWNPVKIHQPSLKSAWNSTQI